MRELFEEHVPVTAILARLDQQDAMLREHSRTLDEHRRTLAEHTRILDQHTRMLEEHTRMLDQNRAAIVELGHHVELLRAELGAQRQESRAELHEALTDSIHAPWRMAMGTAVLLSIMMTGLVVTLAPLL